METSTHVFVRLDAVCQPFTQPYDGPYQIISQRDKQFTTDIKGKAKIISVDRLKTAHLLNEIVCEIHDKIDRSRSSKYSVSDTVKSISKR